MQITAEMIKKVRSMTGSGVMDCKKALLKSDGDLDAAVICLREKGLADAKKKSERIATEGSVGAYIHPGSRIGVLVELNCETDFVAKNDQFKILLKDIAMHIAAAHPLCVRREDLSQNDIEREESIYRAQAKESGKPETIIEKIVSGKLEKYYSENCLMEQSFIKDNDITIEQLLTEKIALLGENISVRRFSRYAVGEGMVSKKRDFADEVKAVLS